MSDPTGTPESIALAKQRIAQEPEITTEVIDDHITSDEYELLEGFLGRKPTFTELGITSALFSEHCSYKSSKTWLREFPITGEHVVQGPGENAGVVSIGDGWVAAFKMESHNHPSYIEPYQGAATGVGGILRDVFTMGARPIACMDALRFGAIDAPRMRSLVDGVVRGIGDYGNCVGIPTVGGETQFHPSYNGNILVNAFALGVCREDQIFTASATGVGNPILYVGSRTGRDGIHGATMASESFDAESEAKRPTVQVGDPFTEKVLLEACIEAMRSGAVVAIQDMGAAGLTSSCFEMADRGGTGIEVDLEKVPLREPGLTPYELMLSESQERMVVVAEQGKEGVLEGVFRKWGLEVVPVGHVTESGRAVLRFDGEVVADMPIRPLVDEAPVYERPVRETQPGEDVDLPVPDDPRSALLDLLGTPDLGDKSWIYGQYDSTVRSNTVVGPGGDAAVLRVKGLGSGLAMSSDVNPVYCSLDPRQGGRQAVAEAVRNLACVGATPLALTDCLNFGNPERPEIAFQLRECIRGMAEACDILSAPVVSGNVSLYNETEDRSVHPTPTVVVVGRIPELDDSSHQRLASHFWREGDRVLLFGQTALELGGSVYGRLLHGVEAGRPPQVDLEAERRLAALLRRIHAQGDPSGVHDLSEGGLAVALAEMCIGGPGLGADVDVELDPSHLFSETQARALAAIAPASVDQTLRWAEELEVPVVELGSVGGDTLGVRYDGGAFEVGVEEMRSVWRAALPKALGL